MIHDTVHDYLLSQHEEILVLGDVENRKCLIRCVLLLTLSWLEEGRGHLLAVCRVV
jgi:hypothetical protein